MINYKFKIILSSVEDISNDNIKFRAFRVILLVSRLFNVITNRLTPLPCTFLLSALFIVLVIYCCRPAGCCVWLRLIWFNPLLLSPHSFLNERLSFIISNHSLTITVCVTCITVTVAFGLATSRLEHHGENFMLSTYRSVLFQ